MSFWPFFGKKGLVLWSFIILNVVQLHNSLYKIRFGQSICWTYGLFRIRLMLFRIVSKGTFCPPSPPAGDHRTDNHLSVRACVRPSQNLVTVIISLTLHIISPNLH